MLLILGFSAANTALGQYSIQHQALPALYNNAENDLEFFVPGLPENEVLSGIFYYRTDGEFAYRQQEAIFENGRFSVRLTVDLQQGNRLEYYFVLTTISGGRYTYPAFEPEENPVQTSIVNAPHEQQQPTEKTSLIDFTILSPKPGAAVGIDDVLIAVAFFYDKTELPPGSIHLVVNDIDVTQFSDTSAYYYSYVPDAIKPGPHKARLLYKTGSTDLLIHEWSFFVIPAQSGQLVQASSFQLSEGRIELGAKNQIIGGNASQAYTGRSQLSGSVGKFYYDINAYLTSLESGRLQPQNRFGARIRYADTWRFDAGHIFPELSMFTISGRRIYGLNSSLHMFRENLNFHVIHGELDREISNLYGNLAIQPVTTSNGSVVDTTYTLNLNGRGTFKRKITGGRIGLGNANKLQFGIQAIRVRDDTASVLNVRNYNDLNLIAFGGQLSPADHAKLSQNPDLLTIQGGSLQPKDNVVISSDIRMGFMNNRVRFEAEGALSALNDNIYNGPLSSERADELGFDIDRSTIDLIERLSWLIIINENMNTLPIRFQEGEGSDRKAEVFFPTSILGANSEFSVRHPRNNLRLQYRWIGPNFNSLANSTIRKDVAGFTVSDRINLFANRLYVTLGLEQLQDNTTGNKAATTYTDTYRYDISWLPRNRNLPQISTGLRFRTRDNGIERFNPYVPEALQNAAVQNFSRNAAGDTLATANPRFTTTTNLTFSVTQQIQFWQATHDVSVNITNMETTDKYFDFGDISSSSFSLNMQSRFSGTPLVTQAGFMRNYTTSGGGQSEITISGIYAGLNYQWPGRKFQANARFALTKNHSKAKPLEIETGNDTSSQNDYFVLGSGETKSEYNTVAFQAGLQYNLNEFHSLILDSNFVSTGMQHLPNDRILELRYLVRF